MALFEQRHQKLTATFRSATQLNWTGLTVEDNGQRIWFLDQSH